MLATIIASFGIGFASGSRAAIPALGIGLAHHTPYFELSEKWLWLASPAVISILAVVALAEVVADRFPDSAELVDLAGWLPKAILAFLGVAATMGSLDASIVTLVSSGLLGAGVAVATDRVRSKARQKTRELADSGAPGADSAAHHLESAAAVGVTAAAIFQPWLVLVAIALAVGLALIAYRASRTLVATARRAGGLQSGDEPDGPPANE